MDKRVRNPSGEPHTDESTSGSWGIAGGCGETVTGGIIVILWIAGLTGWGWADDRLWDSGMVMQEQYLQMQDIFH